MIAKVVAFITRESARGSELLLLAHPYAGNQLPSGTVEENEDPRAAVLREVAEETGLTRVRIEKQIGILDEPLPERMLIVARATRVYARPDATSFDWAEFRRGIWVTRERERDGWTQITYAEPDEFPNARYTTYHITGWVSSDALTAQQRRYLFHLALAGETPDVWTQISDHHTFRLFWSPLAALPPIVPPQNRWVEFALSAL
ncbi:MAG: NUDIX domain-containing protein [Chloroflexi bacterium]|nr:NUDIX domain-containing protein [Chloroflexota bacterium]